jgi:hypothetical protein
LTNVKITRTGKGPLADPICICSMANAAFDYVVSLQTPTEPGATITIK